MRETWVNDSENDYLWLRLHPTGGKSYWSKCVDEDFLDSRRAFLGTASTCTIAIARLKAARELAAAKYGRKCRNKVKPFRRNMMVAHLVTLYLQDYPPDASPWSKRKEYLLTTYVLPTFGNTLLPRVTKDEWETLIDDTVLTHRSQGAHLSKTLKTFLSWSVQRQVLQANPLANYKPDLPLLPPLQMACLDIEALVAIYSAAAALGEPWGTMIGLVILTGEPMEYVRRIKGDDINWLNKTWIIEWSDTGGSIGPRLTLGLPLEAIELLAPFRTAKGCLFPSPRSLFFEQPINFYSEIFDRIKDACGVKYDWEMRDLRLAVRSHILNWGGGDIGVAAWSKQFMSEVVRIHRAQAAPDDEVMI
jgi:hypothetical protein